MEKMETMFQLIFVLASHTPKKRSLIHIHQTNKNPFERELEREAQKSKYADSSKVF